MSWPDPASPHRIRFKARGALLEGERVLQEALRFGARAWASVAAPRALEADDLRGHSCHCSPTWPRHYVHSEALRESCDVVLDWGTNVRNPARPPLPPERMGRAVASSIGPGSRVHVKTDGLAAFVEHVLPRIDAPFVLVTGDSDASPVSRHEGLLDDPKILRWFVQNCDVAYTSPKLCRIPIGLDNPVYTKLEKRLGFALAMALGKSPLDVGLRRNEIGDQGLLEAIRSTLPPTVHRPRRVLCTFHQNQRFVAPDLSNLPDRQDAARALRGRSFVGWPERRLSQAECWTRHGEFAFQASPHGNGLDCFRTWESLILGSIPIVKTSPLDPLYLEHELPVVIVSSWEEVTEANLLRWHERFASAFDEALLGELEARTWIARIRASSEALLR